MFPLEEKRRKNPRDLFFRNCRKGTPRKLAEKGPQAHVQEGKEDHHPVSP